MYIYDIMSSPYHAESVPEDIISFAVAYNLSNNMVALITISRGP